MFFVRHTTAALSLGFGAILACMLGSIYIGFQHLDSTREAWLRDAVFREKVRAAFLMREAVRERSFRLTFATTFQDYFDRDEQRDYFRAVASEFVVARDRLETLTPTAEEDVALEALRKKIKAARPVIDAAMSQVVEYGHDIAAQEDLEAALNAQSNVIEALNTFVSVVEDSSRREAEAASRSIAETQKNMIALSVGAIALALGIGIVVVARETQHLRNLSEHRDQLAELSVTDGLTGIANRRHFDETLEAQWAHATRSGFTISIVLLDVDHFKAYNDRYGHAAGDDCLITVAHTMSGVIERATDVVARVGGEEFACILSDTDSKGALRVAERIRRAVANLGIEHAESTAASCVTVSVGVATRTPVQGEMVEGLYEAAGRRLYQAKESGRNRVAGPA